MSMGFGIGLIYKTKSRPKILSRERDEECGDDARGAPRIGIRGFRIFGHGEGILGTTLLFHITQCHCISL